jgi:predicted DNA-binding protein
MRNNSVLLTRVSSEVRQRFEALAERDARTISGYLRHLIQRVVSQPTDSSQEATNGSRPSH